MSAKNRPSTFWLKKNIVGPENNLNLNSSWGSNVEYYFYYGNGLFDFDYYWQLKAPNNERHQFQKSKLNKISRIQIRSPNLKCSYPKIAPPSTNQRSTLVGWIRSKVWVPAFLIWVFLELCLGKNGLKFCWLVAN